MATTPATTSTNPLTVYISGSSEGKNVDEGEGEGESEGESECEGVGEGEGEERTVEVGLVELETVQMFTQCM